MMSIIIESNTPQKKLFVIVHCTSAPGARSSVSPASSSLSSHLEPVGYGVGTCKYLAKYSLIYYSDLKLVLIIVLAVNV
jgi:hypothetical protein